MGINIVEALRNSDPLNIDDVPTISSYYVDGNYQGVSDGSSFSPFTTLQSALSVALPGDSISVVSISGNYSHLGITSMPSYISITGIGQEKPMIALDLPFNVDGSYSLVGLEYQNVQLYVPEGLNNLLMVGDLKIENSVVHGGLSFWLSAGLNGVGFTIPMNSGQLELLNNVFQLQGASSGAVLNLHSTDASLFSAYQNIVVRNNTFGSGISLNRNVGFNAASIFIENNIFAGENQLHGFNTSELHYNLVQDTNLIGLNNNFGGSTQFVDEANGDFHLLPGSAAIDMGNPASRFNIEPGFNGGVVNVGAYGNTSEAASKLDGDFNLDGKVTLADLLGMTRHITGLVQATPFELGRVDLYPDTPDGELTVSDLLRLQKRLMRKP